MGEPREFCEGQLARAETSREGPGMEEAGA
jgi:hypothetical protein